MVVGRKSHPLFTVVIPLYNKADTIERAIRSVADQTFRDWELIVVNDGSTDASLNIAKGLSAEIPMLIVDKVNGGVSSARNAGAKIAMGKYIALLDGDDMWCPKHLECMASAIVAYPKIGFFGGGYERTSGNYIYYTIPWGGRRVVDVYSALQYGQPFNSSTVVINKVLWQKVGGFDDSYSFYEDYEFFFRLGMHTKCCIVRSISGLYMDDALEQATHKFTPLTCMTRPHLAFVERKIRTGNGTTEMIKYVRTIVRLNWALSIMTNVSKQFDDLRGAFPWIVDSYSPKVCSFGVAKLYAWAIVTYYKFRNHLIIWRRFSK